MSSAHPVFSEALVLLSGAVVSAPLFKKLGLGTVLGYLAAGVVIGPVLGIIHDGDDILSVAELGVVFLLFVIGLELKPSRLWQLRRAIFGLGLAQVTVSGLALFALALAFGVPWKAGLIAGFGLALSSTAFSLQILSDAGDLNTRHGQLSFCILLFQDLAIVPLLALITILDGQAGSGHPMQSLLLAVAAVSLTVIAGRFLLTPLFQIIARTGAREVMIAAALLVVIGFATLIQAAGLSMAMGAFLSGVMLAESSYRHELEADIEPFRGILLGLFFIGVGLSIDLRVITAQAGVILVAVPAVMAVKGLAIYLVCRIGGFSHNDSIRIAFLLPQGGEFGFVLFTAAASHALMSNADASLLTAIVTLSMALTPLAARLSRPFLTAETREEMEEDFDGAGADVLMIGFSRFGQISSQILLAGGRDVTVIDFSADRVRQASNFGFRIYFGDGTRKDVLLAAGIEKAKLIAVCTHDQEITSRIVDLIRSEFPQAKLFVRSYDRVHTIALRAQGVDYELRETLESGLLFGRRTLEALGLDEDMAAAISDDIRRRDEERLVLQAAEGLQAGRHMLYSRPVTPEPLVKPKRMPEDFDGMPDPAADGPAS